MRIEGLLKESGFLGSVRIMEPMSKHTTLGIGGPAEAMAFPEDGDGLSRLRALASANGVPVFILGGGSNLLVRDGGIEGLVINTSRMDGVISERTDGEKFLVRAGAGAPLPKLANYCSEEGLSGLEFAAGIPGTVGGAVYMNAGAYGFEIKDVLHKIHVVAEDGTSLDLGSGELEKGYRHGGLPKNSAVAEAWFSLSPGDAEEIKKKAAGFMSKRRASQPLSSKSAGSTFKNPPGQKAWKLIEEAGLKGTAVGGAAVSEKHANFLINAGGATAKDFAALMELVVKTVQEKFNIKLEPEVKVVGTSLPFL
ncbi:MAG: UDP-N-acetylmuramate dehydrogenase [Nitrospirota bacterium]